MDQFSQRRSTASTSKSKQDQELTVDIPEGQTLDTHVSIEDSQETFGETSLLKQRYVLNFENVQYVGKKKKSILKGISGFALPGEITAIMGPSGAGKSTLLNILSARLVKGATGLITVNNVNIKEAPVKRLFAYVMQDDIFLPKLSVRQQIYYYSLLKLPQGLDYKVKLCRIDEIIGQLGLQKCEHVSIDRVSGGERKRVNIASEIVHNPPVILLDEPTSGLDSTTAFLLVKSLRELAERGHTVLMTIHQPSQAILQLIDRLMLLADGQSVYFGRSVDIYEYFDKCGVSIPLEDNPLDFVMDLISGGNEQKDQILEKAREQMSEDSIEYDEDLKKARELEMLSSIVTHGDGEKPPSKPKKIAYEWPTSYWYQITVLFRRSFVQLRGEDISLLYLFQTIAISLLWGIVLLRMPFRTSYAIDHLGFIFIISSYWIFQRVFGAFLTFPLERAVIIKERASGVYHLSAYFLAKNISEMTVSFIFPTISCIIAYWMTNLNPVFWVFLAFVGIVILSTLSGESLGLLVGAMFPDVRLAMKATTLISLSMLLLSGFYIHAYPVYVDWYKYLSVFRASFDSLTELVLTHSEPYFCDVAGCIPCTINTFIPAISIVSSMNMQLGQVLNLSLLAGLTIGFRILAFIFLKILYSA